MYSSNKHMYTNNTSVHPTSLPNKSKHHVERTTQQPTHDYVYKTPIHMYIISMIINLKDMYLYTLPLS